MHKTYRVYIDGNGYGFGNIGDDAILQGIIKILRTLPVLPEITVGVKDGIRLPFLDSDIKIINSFNFDVAQRMIDNSDCFVVGGGTMIGDELNFKFPLIYNTKRILYAKQKQKKIVLFGIGANKLTTKTGEDLAKKMIRYSGLVTVRDKESSVLCRSITRHHQRIFQTSDPAFLLQSKETERSKKIKKLIRSKGKSIGINVVNEAWANRTGYKWAIATACNELSKREDVFPIFISNEIRPGAFFDYEANKETAAILDCEYLLLEPTYFSPEEMIDIISAFDIFLSMRMHGLIFASIACVPFTTISRIDKVDNFMNQFNRKPSGTIDSISSKSLFKDLLLLLQEREKIIAVNQKIVDDKRTVCWQNMEHFNKYIRSFDVIKTIIDKYYLNDDLDQFKHILNYLNINETDNDPG